MRNQRGFTPTPERAVLGNSKIEDPDRLVRGFTLIELLVVIGIIAILAAIVIVAINPARQFQQARNTQRTSNVRALLDGVHQLMADNQGNWSCPSAGALPTSTINIASTAFDIGPCLVPIYLSSLPYDPSSPSAYWTDTTDYNTAYSIVKDATGRVTISAPGAELGEDIHITR